jgi:hypothetical protein
VDSNTSVDERASPMKAWKKYQTMLKSVQSKRGQTAAPDQKTSISRRNLTNPWLLGALYAQNDFSTLALKSCILSTLALEFSTFHAPRERFSELNPRLRLR